MRFAGERLTGSERGFLLAQDVTSTLMRLPGKVVKGTAQMSLGVAPMAGALAADFAVASGNGSVVATPAVMGIPLIGSALVNGGKNVWRPFKELGRAAGRAKTSGSHEVTGSLFTKGSTAQFNAVLAHAQGRMGVSTDRVRAMMNRAACLENRRVGIKCDGESPPSSYVLDRQRQEVVIQVPDLARIPVGQHDAAVADFMATFERVAYTLAGDDGFLRSKFKALEAGASRTIGD